MKDIVLSYSLSVAFHGVTLALEVLLVRRVFLSEWTLVVDSKRDTRDRRYCSFKGYFSTDGPFTSSKGTPFTMDIAVERVDGRRCFPVKDVPFDLLVNDGKDFVVRFDQDIPRVRIAPSRFTLGTSPQWTIGTSHTDRWNEPVL